MEWARDGYAIYDDPALLDRVYSRVGFTPIPEGRIPDLMERRAPRT